jgi:pectate lyase
MALSVKGGSLANGANVRQWTKSGNLAQTFRITYDKSNGYYTIINAQSGRVLEVVSDKAAKGNVRQNAANGSHAQLWGIRRFADGSFRLFSAVDGRSLDVSGSSSKRGANVQTYRSSGIASQRWNLVGINKWLPNGTYQLVTSANTKNDVSVASRFGKGAKGVTAARNSSNTSQKWQLVWCDDGFVRLVNLGSGYVLALADESGISGTQVVQEKWSDANTQKWLPSLVKGGIILKSQVGGLMLNVQNGLRTTGTSLQASSSCGAAAKRFHLVKGKLYSTNTPYVVRSVEHLSKAVGIELKESYYRQAVANVKSVAEETQSTLFEMEDSQ